jgi:hypothetical protein
MKRLMRILPFMLLALFSAGSVYADTLTSLLNGGSITAGDKLFDSWELLFYDASDARRFNPDNIQVTALSGGGMSPGLAFSVSNQELTVTGDEQFAYVDLMFGFHVSVLDPAMTITNNSLAFSPAGAWLYYAVDDGYNLGSYMRETVGTDAGLDNLGANEIEFSVFNDESAGASFTENIYDSASFAAQSELWITKNILVWAVDDTDKAGLLGFEQHFSQSAVPEPSTLALMGLGIAGLAVLRRMRK